MTSLLPLIRSLYSLSPAINEIQCVHISTFARSYTYLGAFICLSTTCRCCGYRGVAADSSGPLTGLAAIIRTVRLSRCRVIPLTFSIGIHDSSPPPHCGGGRGAVGVTADLFAFSCASRALLSFSFSENIATDLARFIRLCFTRVFFAASSSAAAATK